MSRYGWTVEVHVVLGDALRPMSFTEFTSQYLGQRHLIVKNHQGRFGQLASWLGINEALRHSRVSNRIGLVQNGVNVPLAAYVASPTSPETSYIDARKVERLLAGGASLVMTQVDELLDGVQELAESCEEAFRMSVGVNLYAGWRTDKAFDLHWDGHDTLILQIAGRKRWKVYEPTVLHPVGGRRGQTPTKPVDEPVWEGVLEDGDVLYMPRGWWHVAFPLDEPTLHLTVGLKHRTGLDLLKWAVAKAAFHVAARRDVPHLENTEAQRLYVRELREVMTLVLSDDATEAFMSASDDEINVRPRLGLPFSVSRTEHDIGDDTPLRLSIGSRLHFDTPDDQGLTKFNAGGVGGTCSSALVPALELLRATRSTTLRALCSVIDSSEHINLRVIVMTMEANGIVWAEPSATASGDIVQQSQEVNAR